MEKLQQQRNGEKKKILIDYLKIFQLELPIIVFDVSFPRRIGIYIGENSLPPHQLAI
jgi:hypothetical protein